MAKPLIKWVGGKTQLLPQITAKLPKFVQNGEPYIYVEPFVGGGSVALHLLDIQTNPNPPKKAIINDINSDLVNLYEVIKNKPSPLLDELKSIQSDYDKLLDKESKKPYFYEKRALFNTRKSSNIEQASLFVFLNRAGFNGLYRVNNKNEFNVPIGSYKRPIFVFEELIYQVSELLQNVIILNDDYQHTLKEVQKLNTDNLPVLFYFDPPYKPISETASFTAYATNDFNDSHQVELANFCKKIDALGYHWIASNSDPKNTDVNNHFFDELYQGFEIKRVKAARSINSNSAKRGQISEVLMRN
ncbi:DNA adenine methylase [Psychrobacter sp. HD31]|uniref:DNA adenine methylase n=1 Tax=Psychrobacter sp. HD31 TaxID=3112003 RepID=UPI003DA4F880